MRETRGAIFLAVLIAVFVLVFLRVPQTLFGGSGETVRAVVADPLGLVKGDPVRVDGVRVGDVRGVELAEDARTATVELEVSGVDLHSDATVAVRERTLLGANFAVDLDPGSAGAGKLAGPITTSSSQVELEDLVNTFRPNARAGLRGLLSELPRGLSDADAPKEALATLSSRARDLERGLEAVRGEHDGDLRRLVANTDAVVRSLDATRGPGVRDVVEGGAATLQVTAARRAELRSTLRQAGPLLPRVRATAADLDATLRLADPLIADLRGPAPDVAPTVRRLRPVVAGADRLLGRARPLLRSLRPAAAALAAAGRGGAPLLRELTPSVARVQDRILRDLALKSPESGHSTFEMIGPALAGVVGASAGYDGSTNFIRFLASGGERAIQAAPCSTAFTDPTAASKVNCDLLLDAISRVFTP